MPHRPLSRRPLLGTGLALAGTALAPRAFAQGGVPGGGDGWPDRPVRLVVPFPGGSTPDLVARSIGGYLASHLGQPVVVDNRAGAGGNIGTDLVAKATDGHTIGLSINGPITTAPALFPSLPYDPLRDLRPIAMAVRAPQLLVIAPGVPARDLKGFLAHVKANPGKLSFGSVGAGSGGHLAMVELMAREGLRMEHIPYRGFPQAVLDLVAGRIETMIVTIGAVLPQVQEGKAIALASTGERRAPEVPEVPTLAEAGISDATSYGWSGLFAPAGMPEAHRARLEALAVAGFKEPVVRAPLEKAGFEVMGLSSRDFATFIAAETARWGGLIERLGIRAEG
ncbi:tripartite tricarboxylate transporter substrate binding protein [Roseomonas sp. OT10]|uniref:Bug family tripartite tricarboxylate transporter substrate binding protein n=1 Tax=Roseomonas cutis TaxID=2897332 RepID=UPI001E4AE348|nr:tripartite tricarboxylate transporter substrate binding protein [Roseomonas sp. OT10]UFN49586.1 tripartite tricarboxylate transporter substrate binding protein [Roseomonas sp. OT10]